MSQYHKYHAGITIHPDFTSKIVSFESKDADFEEKTPILILN